MELNTALVLLQIIIIVGTVAKVYTNIREQLTELQCRISSIESQYKPNGGSSMKDAVDRIEKRLTSFEEKLSGFEKDLDEVKEEE